MRKLVFNKLAIQNFRSFQEDQVFRFPSAEGVYLLSGRNNLEPELGANAVGKSSLWDALVWVLYGKTARGLRGATVANWTNEDGLCSVALELAVQGVYVLVTRTANPNSLTVQTGEVAHPVITSQEQLNNLIGMEYTSFLHSILMGQFNQFFFDLSPTEKLELFTQAMDLQRWVNLSGLAKRVTAAAQAEHDEKQSRLVRVEGQLEALEAQITSLHDASTLFAQEKHNRKLDLERERGVLVDRLDKQNSVVAAANKANKTFQVKKAECEKKFIAVTTRFNETNLERRESEMESGFANVALKELNEWLSNLERNQDNECEGCGRPITGALVALQRENRQVELRDATNVCVGWNDHLRQLDEQLTKMGGERKDLEQELKRLDSSNVLSTLTEANRLRDKLETSLEAADRAMSALAKQENPHAKGIKAAKEAMAAATVQRKELTEQTRELATHISHVGFWAQGFKDLRLFLVERALLELEVLVNNSLIQLGLNGWTIKLDIERENKSGGVTKGFSVFITSPASRQPVAWESWCGGETQRLRIASSLAFSNLILTRMNIFTNLIVFDEPTQHLSEEGVADLLMFFNELSTSHSKQIWIVEHHSMTAGDFTDEVVVVKDETGSRFESKGG